MRPIPHSTETEGEETDDTVRLTTRREREEPDSEDDETWLAVQEF